MARKRRIAPVLIVDKDDEARRELAALLGDAGYPVVEATSGEEAIRIVREQDLSLALLEVALEDVSGYEVCRTIRGRWDRIHVSCSSPATGRSPTTALPD